MTLSRFSRIVRQRVRSLFRASQLDAELQRELALHFEALVEEHILDGLPPADARRAARVALGNPASLREECRDQRRVTWLHDLRQDIVYGLRMLAKNRAFTAVAIVSLALGIGANTAVLGVMGAVGDGLTAPHADRLVVLRSVPLDKPSETRGVAAGDYLAWKERNRTLDAIELSLTGPRDLGADENGAPAERTSGKSTTPGFFATLGVQPFLGRTFTEQESRTRAPVVVISHRLWQRRYNGDPQILNKRIRIDRTAVTIIGVMPEELTQSNARIEFWTPMFIEPDRALGAARLFGSIARLKPGVRIEDAQRDLEAIAAQLARERPELNVGWGVRVTVAPRIAVWLDERAFDHARGRSGARPADRMCKRGGAAPRARLRSPPGDRHAGGARRWTAAHHPSADHRERPPLDWWRPAGARRRVVGCPRPGGTGSSDRGAGNHRTRD